MEVLRAPLETRALHDVAAAVSHEQLAHRFVRLRDGKGFHSECVLRAPPGEKLTAKLAPPKGDLDEQMVDSWQVVLVDGNGANLSLPEYASSSFLPILELKL